MSSDIYAVIFRNENANENGSNFLLKIGFNGVYKYGKLLYGNGNRQQVSSLL